jgi:hypothetical protein
MSNGTRNGSGSGEGKEPTASSFLERMDSGTFIEDSKL